MKKTIKRLIAMSLCSVAMVGTTTFIPAQTAQAAQVTSVQNQGVVEDLNSSLKSVDYSQMIRGEGSINLKVDLPRGVKLTTTDPYKFSDAIKQNYDISISEGVHYSKEYFTINVNWANSGIEYVGEWVMNIDGSVFTDGKDRKLAIEVNNDLYVGTPTITTNMTNGVTVQQLNQGFDLVMDIDNAKFNTACFGGFIRVSMMNTSGLGIYPVVYCNALKPNQVKMRVQAMNGVESWRPEFEFKIQGDATDSAVPITVKIPIIR
ncbi:hypothetical protein [uncultured Clostridium sp.]|jgi:hypothetical protein|uniref:hypothetical protein n=1 Tax=uncultured Clostridium sp. TaxID=59620 RepID=UPI0026279C20|nr:hypothetical protein [uncultured Clostridium sp.]